MDRKPWEVHPALTEERLCYIANIIRDVRHKTLGLYDPNNGDGVWSLGCRIYERTINTIDHEKGKLSWLDTIRDGLYFVLLVEGVPIRFYRGDVDNPNTRSLRRKFPELEAQQCTFSFYEPEWFWRLVAETDADGEILRIVMVQYTESGDSKNPWDIPITEPVKVETPSLDAVRESIVLDRPVVKSKEEKTVGVDQNE
ncbi:MAG: hypothetical protein M1508_09915 [Nitrospirae bacterium]|nr:hypothetical protein [Nitrospirota bacterium]